VLLALRIDAVNGFQELKRRCLGIQASSILTASSITSRTFQNASESSPVRFFVFGKYLYASKKHLVTEILSVSIDRCWFASVVFQMTLQCNFIFEIRI